MHETPTATIKVAYLIVMRSFPGLLKQINYDEKLTSTLSQSTWSHVTFLDRADTGSRADQLPKFMRGVFGRNLFAWFWMLRHARGYDYVIVRHMPFDIFALLFAWFVPNRITVHHAKEEIELKMIRSGWKGSLAARIEGVTGGVSVRSASALLGVTRDICKYQRKARNLGDDFPIALFPNGVEMGAVNLLTDARPSFGPWEIAFMAGRFSPWHGLDILLDAFSRHDWENTNRGVILHLVGTVDEFQKAKIDYANSKSKKLQVISHGVLKTEEYTRLFERCVVGIGSLAMDRVGVADGSTLKVREMLAMGLPVFSGHLDAALPKNFDYYWASGGSVDQLLKFVERSATVDRMKVRKSAEPFISKATWIKNLEDFLVDLRATRDLKAVTSKWKPDI